MVVTLHSNHPLNHLAAMAIINLHHHRDPTAAKDGRWVPHALGKSLDADFYQSRRLKVKDMGLHQAVALNTAEDQVQTVLDPLHYHRF